VIDSRLSSLIRRASALDNTDVTKEQVESVRTVCHVVGVSLLATIRGSLQPGSPDEDDVVVDGWPSLKGADPVLEVAYNLALATCDWIHAFNCPAGSGSWWENYRGRAFTRWADCRRAAEVCAYGAVTDDTIGALQAAERRMAEPAIDNTIRSLIPPEAPPTVVIV
jgi:hypothetical protein